MKKLLLAPLCLLVLCGGASAIVGGPVFVYFPLEPGNSWTYVEESTGSEAVVSVSAGDSGNEALVSDGLRHTEETIRLVIGGNLTTELNWIDIEKPGEGLVPYYRFLEPSFVHRDPLECDDGVTVTVADYLEDVETPAGFFPYCLRLDFARGICDDAGTVTEWWANHVGLVKRVEESIAGPRVHVLKSAVIPEHRVFMRGDANGTFRVDIADAIFILNSLFLGGAPSSCPDSADANGDAKLDVSDPIAILVFLFLEDKPGRSLIGQCDFRPWLQISESCLFFGCYE